jgi:hypothetical protein
MLDNRLSLCSDLIALIVEYIRNLEWTISETTNNNTYNFNIDDIGFIVLTYTNLTSYASTSGKLSKTKLRSSIEKEVPGINIDFISVPFLKGMNIGTLLMWYGMLSMYQKFPDSEIFALDDDSNRSVSIKSNILTNKNNDDIINNNILELARYVGEDKYPKVILHTDKIKKWEFIITPHEHTSEIHLNKETIIHYHCWMNNRYHYNDSMQRIDFLYDFSCSMKNKKYIHE